MTEADKQATEVISNILCLFVAVVFFCCLVGGVVLAAQGKPQHCVEWNLSGMCTTYER